MSLKNKSEVVSACFFFGGIGASDGIDRLRESHTCSCLPTSSYVLLAHAYHSHIIAR